VQGRSIDDLAREYNVHRSTVLHRFGKRGVPRRRVARKLTDDAVARAAVRYAEGSSMAVVAAEFRVSERTLAREFRRAGVMIRQRNGWPQR